MSTLMERFGQQARAAARGLAATRTDERNAALVAMADALDSHTATILEANAADVAGARERGIGETLVERLTLNPKRMAAMSEGLRQIAALPDPIGEVLDGSRRPNGLAIQRVRVPLGVIGVIYESRPNVTADAAGLCVKSGNAVILRGGSESIRSNTAIARALSEGADRADLPPSSIQFIESTDRQDAIALMRADRYVDLLMPRGGERLKKTLQENATVPVLASMGGNCHTYIDASADPEMAIAIAENAKVSRPSVCNAMETLLVHASIAPCVLPELGARLAAAGVELRGCERTRAVLPHAAPAMEEDWATEYLALILAIRVVDSLDEALDHIAAFGTGHSEAIVTRDYEASERFTHEVDAACVYVNASTRFTDGGEFGMGAEVAISTQKLHARGPVGIRELTTYKTIVRGSGQIRK